VDRQLASSAVLVLWGRAAQVARKPVGQWQIVIGDVPFEFHVRADSVSVRRGELLAPDGGVTVSAADTFALLDATLDVGNAVESGRVSLSGRLDVELFGKLLGLEASRP